MKKITKSEKIKKKETIEFLVDDFIEESISEFIEEVSNKASKVQTRFEYGDKLLTKIYNKENIELDEYDFESVFLLVNQLKKNEDVL